MDDETAITWVELAWAAGYAGGAVVAGLLLAWLLRLILGLIAKRSENLIDDVLVKYGMRPVWLLLPAIALLFALPMLALPDEWIAFSRHAVSLVLIGAVAWLLIELANAVVAIVELRFRMDVADNLEARRIHTQVRVLMRCLDVLVIIVAIAIMLMTFPRVRELGISMLASAGLAGIVVGFAARPVLENLIAGVQIALTQPIRIDDVVIIGGEWGRIEEIRTTYVVVRIWDQRRLVVPLNWFVQNIFENWTRTTADITGTVFLNVDYRTPLEPIRTRLGEIVSESGKWDGKAWGLQVTDATEQTIQIRALMTASDGGTAWELRCYVREKLVEFLQREYPESLPRLRAEVEDHREESEESEEKGSSKPAHGPR